MTAFPSSHTLVVDTSAIIALLLEEDGHREIQAAMRSTDHLLMSAPTYVELFVVIQRRFDPLPLRRVEQFILDLNIEVAPFDDQQAFLAREGFRRFGKGRHPAALNFGDCFSYALAKHLNEPLLFKGEDFRQTDVLIA